MKKTLTLLSVLFVSTCGLLAGAFSDEEKANSFSTKEVSKPAVPVVQNAPLLPEELKDVEGSVVVAFIISEDGSVTAPRVLKTDNEVLNDPAILCVSAWSFEPAEKDGASVAMRAMVKVRFVAAE
jgi:TonB family protein